MALPAKCYVALSVGGVYYTENLNDPGGDPTWGAVNAGLASTAIASFDVDPFAADTRQWCVADGVVYIRESGGDWTSLLSTAEAQVVTGYARGIPTQVVADRATEGTIWVLVDDNNLLADQPSKWALLSTDYGDTWASHPLNSEAAYNYAWGGIAAHGSHVYIINNDSFNAQAIHYSTNQGASFTRRGYGSSTLKSLKVEVNPYAPGDAYGPGSGGMYRVRSGSATLIHNAYNTSAGSSPPLGVMWFDPDDTDHMRLLLSDGIRYTADDWSTSDVTVIADGYLRCFAPIVDTDDTDTILIGRGSHEATTVKLAALVNGETDSTLVNVSGDNYDTPPYTNAIPSNAGAVMAIRVVPENQTEGPSVPPEGGIITRPDTETPVTLVGLGGQVQAVSMPGYAGIHRGVPMPGDRAAWDETDYPDLHARDIQESTFRHHIDPDNPPPHNLYELDDVDTDGVVDGDALLYDDATATWLPADVLTPTEHTAIGDGSPHHASVTLGAGNDPALALSGQELTLTMPTITNQYRQYTYVDNGDSTWSFVVNGDGMPVFGLLDTE